MTALATRRIAGFGWTPDLPDHRDLLFGLEERVEQASALPAEIDLAPQMPPIYNQGELGSCTGNGIARVLEHQEFKQGEGSVTPSRLFIYFGERVIENTVDEDSGAQIRDGIKVVASEGAPPESLWPYDISQFATKPSAAAYTEALKHEAIKYQRIILGGRGAPIRTALSQGKPIVMGFSVPQSFEDGTWDPTKDPLPVPGPNEGFIGGHCVVLTGYDFTRKRFPVNALQIDNSWGDAFGMGGRFWMDADWFNPSHSLVSDLWVIGRVS